MCTPVACVLILHTLQYRFDPGIAAGLRGQNSLDQGTLTVADKPAVLCERMYWEPAGMKRIIGRRGDILQRIE